MRVGVLALQGDHAAHAGALARAAAGRGSSVEVRRVRRSAELGGLDGLVIPGGESTTLLKLMEGTDLEGAIVGLAASGAVIFGTCAGAILIAREVVHPEQRSLGLLDARVERNAYGRQVDSFVADLEAGPAGDVLAGRPLEGVFIRAPRFVELGRAVEVLALHDGEPVLVREGNVLAATFHPELTDDERVPALFLDSCRARLPRPAFVTDGSRRA